MRIKTMVLVAVLLMVVFMGSAYAQQDPIEKAIQVVKRKSTRTVKMSLPAKGAFMPVFTPMKTNFRVGVSMPFMMWSPSWSGPSMRWATWPTNAGTI